VLSLSPRQRIANTAATFARRYGAVSRRARCGGVSRQALYRDAPKHPTLRGQLDGELTWPVFTPGSTYRAAFPDRCAQPVTADVQSRQAHGFPAGLLATWAGSIPLLNQLQIDAINQYEGLQGEHLVVSAPTSSGKTLIGELAALRGVLERKRAFFLLPLKALVLAGELLEKGVFFSGSLFHRYQRAPGASVESRQSAKPAPADGLVAAPIAK
jgi:hypothetical protein